MADKVHRRKAIEDLIEEKRQRILDEKRAANADEREYAEGRISLAVLNQRTERHTEEIARLKAEIADLKRELAEIESSFDAEPDSATPPTADVTKSWFRKEHKPALPKRINRLLIGIPVVLFLIGAVVLVILCRRVPDICAASNVNAQAVILDESQLGFSLKSQVQLNAQWPQYPCFIKDVEMVLVPAGCFQMGGDLGIADRSNSGRDDGGRPCIETLFWLDRFEVSNGQYIRLTSSNSITSPSDNLGLPRTNVTWYEADRYCREQRGGRLPSEKEWEYAARGVDGNIFPWGIDWDGDRPIWSRHQKFSRGETPQPVEADESRGDVSWVGAYDLAGNVSEWTGSIEAAYPYEDQPENPLSTSRAVRGSSYSDGDQGRFRSTFRRFESPEKPSEARGFRCVIEIGPL